MTAHQPAERHAAPASVRRAWFLLGGLITAAVLAFGVLVAWQVHAGTGLPPETEQSTVTTEGVPETLIVQGSSAEVELIGTAAEAVTAELNLRGRGNQQPVVDTDWQGSDLLVDFHCRYTGIPLWFSPGCGLDYAAQLPHASNAEVRLSSGSITAEGLTGDADLKTTSGAIEVRDVAGDLRTSASSGSTVATGLTSETATAQTTAGGISLEFVEQPARIEVEATSGNIELSVPRGEAYRVITDSSSGRIDIDVATDPEAESIIDLRTTSGSITVGYSE